MLKFNNKIMFSYYWNRANKVNFYPFFFVVFLYQKGTPRPEEMLEFSWNLFKRS